MSIGDTREVLRRIFLQRCFYLFVTLLALVTVAPLIDAEHGGIVIRNLLNACIILFAAAAVGRSVAAFLAIMALATPALVLRWMSLAPEHAALFDLSMRFDAAVYAATISLLLGHVFARDVRTADRLWGAAAAYLMTGVLWSFLYAIVYHADAQAFAIRSADANMDLLYFSFVTLTTTGYGDIIPMTPLAKTAALIESIVGQLFLAILIAKLVGVQSPMQRDTHASPNT